MPPSRPITHTKFELIFVEVCPERPVVDTVQDFLCKLHMKSHMNLVRESIFYYIIFRPTKIINRATKIGAFFSKEGILKIKVFKKMK